MEHPEQFKVVTVEAEERFRMPEGVRLTVDTKDDIKLVRRIYRRLHQPDRVVLLSRTVELLKENPEWVGLNKDVFQKPVTSSELDEAAEAEEEAAEEPEEEAPEPEAEETGDEAEAAAEEEPAKAPEEPEEEETPRDFGPGSPEGLHVVIEKPPENDKLDALMAEAVSKEEEEAKRKEEAPSLDDVLSRAGADSDEKPSDTSELDKLFGGSAEATPTEEAEPAPAEETPAEETSAQESSGEESSEEKPEEPGG
jgi:hypothetical protein